MYLLKLLARYKKITLSSIGTLLSIGGGIWNFDFHKLFPKTILEPEMIWGLRMGLTLLLPSAFLIALIILILYDHKKIKTKYEIKITDLENKLVQKSKSVVGGVIVNTNDSDLDKIKPRLTSGGF